MKFSSLTRRLTNFLDPKLRWTCLVEISATQRCVLIIPYLSSFMQDFIYMGRSPTIELASSAAALRPDTMHKEADKLDGPS